MRRRLHWVALACFVAGFFAMVPFDGPASRIIGMSLLAAFMVLGLLAIATPEYLQRADDEPDQDTSAAP
ncbi:MAG: hypothetical protein MUE51_14585 [Thermoleophilia bacterium]|jgi:hypothetical protein|nr:hypothetical protein [Thermoleophilia bacterium]